MASRPLKFIAVGLESLTFFQLARGDSALFITNACATPIYYEPVAGNNALSWLGPVGTSTIEPHISHEIRYIPQQELHINVNTITPVDNNTGMPALRVFAGLTGDQLQYRFFETWGAPPSPMTKTKRIFGPKLSDRGDAYKGDCTALVADVGVPAPDKNDDGAKKTCKYDSEMNLELLIQGCT